MIEDIDDSFVVKDKSAESIAKTLKKCLENPKKIHSRKFAKNIDLKAINNRLINIYQDVLNQTG